jgi:uncharacterized coiled-coil protein SlyX
MAKRRTKKVIEEERKKADYSLALLRQFHTDQRIAWLQDRVNDQAYAYGQPWDPVDRKKVRRRGQTDYSINRLLPIYRHYVSTITAKLPEVWIVPEEISQYDPHHLLNLMYNHVLIISYFPAQYRRLAGSVIAKGMGNLYVYRDNFSSSGLGDLKLRHLDNNYVYLDPNASDIYLDDSSALIIAMPKVLGDCIAIYPDKEKEIREAAFPAGVEVTDYIRATSEGRKGHQELLGSQVDQNLTEDRCLVIQRQVRERINENQLYRSDTGTFEGLVDDDYEPTKNQKTGEPIEFVTPIYRTQIRMVTSVNNVYVGEEIIPCEHFTNTSFFYEDTENPFPFGAIAMYKNMQDLINRLYSLMLLNLELSGTRIMGPKGSFDKTVWSRDLGKQFGILEYKDKLHGNKPEIIHMEGLTQSFFAILNQLEQELAYIASSQSANQGQGVGMPHTRGATFAIMDEGRQRLEPMVQAMDFGMERVADTILQMIPYAYPVERMMELWDGDFGDTRKVMINLSETMNNMADLRAKVKIKTGSSVRPHNTRLMDIYFQIAEMTGSPAAVMHGIERMTEIPDRRKLMEALDTSAKQQQMIEQLDEAVGELQGVIKNQEQQMKAMDRNLSKTKAESKYNAIAVNMRAEAKVIINRIKDLYTDLQKNKETSSGSK